MSSCCHVPQPQNGQDHNHDHTHAKTKKFDPILHGSLAIIAISFTAYMFMPQFGFLHEFVYTLIELAKTMWWGIALGVIFVGLMSKVPREYFTAILGRGDTFGGIVRATIAGVLLDMCSHGILIIAAKLYERGASLGQVMAFLIASPWNSLSLTIVLIALVGWKWTLVFTLGSIVIAVVTGVLYQILTKRGILPDNPNKVELAPDFSVKNDAKHRLKSFKFTRGFFKDVTIGGFNEAKMLIKWLLLGMIIAASIRAFVPPEIFVQWFGPTMFGLIMTLIATTIIEVCSEGSTPIASEILNRAGAPGNSFTFLMAGVSTDYTEMLIIREFSKSWKTAFTLPLLTVPQVLLIGYILNSFGGG
jgi:uncharacterized membrane protein YraQ (UPF0718 family)